MIRHKDGESLGSCHRQINIWAQFQMPSSSTSIWSWILYISKNKYPWRKSRLHKNGWTRHIWHSSHGLMFKMIVFGICVQTSDVQVVKFKINLWQHAGYCHVMVFTSCCQFWVFSNKSTAQLKWSVSKSHFIWAYCLCWSFYSEKCAHHH